MQEGRRSGLSTNRPLEFTNMYMFLKEKKKHITYVHPRSRCARHYVISGGHPRSAFAPTEREEWFMRPFPGIRKRDGSAEYWASYIPVGRAIRRPLLNFTRVGFTAALRSRRPLLFLLLSPSTYTPWNESTTPKSFLSSSLHKRATITACAS